MRPAVATRRVARMEYLVRVAVCDDPCSIVGENSYDGITLAQRSAPLDRDGPTSGPSSGLLSQIVEVIALVLAVPRHDHALGPQQLGVALGPQRNGLSAGHGV